MLQTYAHTRTQNRVDEACVTRKGTLIL